jgi:hypothetical protein
MPASKVHRARSVPAATASKSTKASAKKPAAAKGKTSNSPTAGKGLPRKAKSKAAKRPSRDVNEKPAATKRKGAAPKPALLAGGNPQIAKADGDAPVQAYIAAMPGWKSDVGRRLDALIVRTVPGVRKAVKWNSPFYGVEGQGWFLNFHCFTKYVKVAFLRGTSLRPVPPGESKHKEVRYLDIREDDQLDEAQMATWIRQAAALPGWVP